MSFNDFKNFTKNLHDNNIAKLWDDERLKKFDTYFVENIKPKVNEINNEVVKIRKLTNYSLWIFFGIVTFQILLTTILRSGSVMLTLFVTIPAFVLIYYFYIEKPKNKLNLEFKNNILPLVVKFLDPSANYSPKISNSAYLNTKLVHQVFNEYTSDPDIKVKMEDNFSGKKDGIPFDFCELNIEKKIREMVAVKKPDGSEAKEEKTRTVSVFKGLYLKSKFLDTGYNGFTYILDKNHESNMTNLASSMEYIELESPDYTKYFKTYSTDQVEARMALQTNLMYELTEFRKVAPGGISVLITPEDLEIFFSTQNNSFELRLDQNLEDKNTYLEFLVPITKCLDLLNILNTNKQSAID